MVITYF